MCRWHEPHPPQEATGTGRRPADGHVWFSARPSTPDPRCPPRSGPPGTVSAPRTPSGHRAGCRLGRPATARSSGRSTALRPRPIGYTREGQGSPAPFPARKHGPETDRCGFPSAPRWCGWAGQNKRPLPCPPRTAAETAKAPPRSCLIRFPLRGWSGWCPSPPRRRLASGGGGSRRRFGNRPPWLRLSVRYRHQGPSAGLLSSPLWSTCRVAPLTPARQGETFASQTLSSRPESASPQTARRPGAAIQRVVSQIRREIAVPRWQSADQAVTEDRTRG